MACRTDNCPPDCSWVFGEIRVLPLINDGAQVEWLLHPLFRDPSPYIFELQYGYTGNPAADDWTAVGPAAQNVFAMTDDTKRLYGKHLYLYYRIKLTSGLATYYSQPVPYHDLWDWQDKQQIKNILRQEKVRLVQGRAGVLGYLLKRRLHGERCPQCIDPQTQESRNPQCELCYGTEYLHGYYDPYPCFYVEKGLETVHTRVASPRHTTNDGPAVPGRMLNIPQVHSMDVWVEKHSDLRWVLRSIRSVADIKGRPIVVSATLCLLPFTHPVYRLGIDGQR